MAQQGMVGWVYGLVALGSASTTYYFPLAADGDANQTSLTAAQQKWGFACTITSLYLHVPSNTRTTATVVALNVNGVDQALAVTIPGSSTTTTPSTTPVVINPGDLVCIAVTTGTGSGGARLCGMVSFETSGQVATQQASFGTLSYTVNKTLPFSGGISNGTDGTLSGTVAMETATLSRMQVVVTTTPSSNQLIRLQKNFVAVNQTVTVTGGGPAGVYEDTVNTDGIVADDSYFALAATPSSSTTVRGAGITYTGGATNRVPMVCGRSVSTLGSGITRYSGPFGRAFDSATESQVQAPSALTGTISRLTVEVRSNPSTQATNVIQRVNGATPASAPTVVIPAAGTAVYSDTVNVAAVVPGDLLSTVAGNTQDAAIDVTAIGCLFTAAGAVVPVGGPTTLMMGV